jgi:hypothetical protein
MANWEVTKTTRHGKPIEEHTAKVRGGSYKIEADVGSQYGVLYWWDDLRGFGRIESGTIAALKRKAETMPAKDARGLAGLERLANMSRSGKKDMMAASDMTTPEAIAKMMEAWNKIEAQAKKQFPNASKEELYRITKSAFESALKFKFSRPGAKATFKIEDRFYFGKGRKERFADDAKQIAQTILAQLGGGRFVAMTGAKNLAFYNNPPGLRMSIGRGAKDAIKYLRVDYDRGSDTYTMIFSNKSGSTVKSVNHVYADSLQRVFTSTTGFDTHL